MKREAWGAVPHLRVPSCGMPSGPGRTPFGPPGSFLRQALPRVLGPRRGRKGTAPWIPHEGADRIVTRPV